ncbi:protein of unknown function-containing protein [Forsythia ovata]|uniref:TIM-barrel domain-containing protein n=1 Tax=Forsythia ovata TaxID=205694 RepID=A0ABD1W565_9LAMI
MAKAGVGIVVAHMGLTTSGSIGAKPTLSKEENVSCVQAIADVAHKINYDAIVLYHGAQQLPPQFMHLALGCVTMDMDFLVEAQSEKKLLEKLFGAVKICQIEITSTTFVDNAMPSKNVLPYKDENENECELWVLL